MFLKREINAFRFIAMVLLAIIASTVFVCSASADYQDLLNLTGASEDVRMNAQDLAFFLVTHDFDATPKGDHVDVNINGLIYRLKPNAGKPGLADIELQ
ncbi:MAG: hypothetical protein NTU95_07650 [Methanothrix sp.]|nr:hypothetical protein [Methanothrix sp.]